MQTLNTGEFTAHGCYRARDGECYYLASFRTPKTRDAETKTLRAYVQVGDDLELRATLIFGVTGTALATAEVRSVISDVEEFLSIAGVQHLKFILDEVGTNPNDAFQQEVLLDSHTPVSEYRLGGGEGEIDDRANLRSEILKRLESCHRAGMFAPSRDKLLSALCSRIDWIDTEIEKLISEGLLKEIDVGWYQLTPEGRSTANAESASEAITVPTASVRAAAKGKALPEMSLEVQKAAINAAATPSRLVVNPSGDRLPLDPAAHAEILRELEDVSGALRRLKEAIGDFVSATTTDNGETNEQVVPGIGHNRPPEELESLQEVTEEGLLATQQLEIRVGTLRAVWGALKYFSGIFGESAAKSAGITVGPLIVAGLATVIAEAVGMFDKFFIALDAVLKVM